MTDEQYLKSRILDLAAQAERQRIYTHTGFLTPPEQALFLSVMKEGLPVSAGLAGKNESAIRKIAVFGSFEEFGYEWDDPVQVLHIRPKAEKFAEELSHRDYLGAIMALGIERELTGDIVIRGKEAWVYVLEKALPYLLLNLTQIRRTNVCCEAETEEIPELRPAFRELKCNVASERVDLLLAAASGVNRDAAKKLLAEEKVFINGRTASSAGVRVKAGDELVIRGVGKFIYDGVENTTKKGRINIRFRKYI